MFRGLEHTAIASPAPETLAHWYADHLDFRINYAYDGNYFVRAANGSLLEIIAAQGERTEEHPRQPGLRHLAIEVDDFDAAYQQLQQRGVQFQAAPYENQGNRLVFFYDGDGNLLHLIQRPHPLP